jgi:DNA polymerase III epsilon subunit-like protein
MRVIVFDTETTGLPKTRVLSYGLLNLWPYVVQLSYLIYDTDDKELIKIRDHIIAIPYNIEISEESSKLHGITNDISYSQGVKIENILEEFLEDLKICDFIVGHNINFDINMIKAELMRLHTNMNKNMDYYYNSIDYLTDCKKYYCTMQESIDLCAIKQVNKSGKEYFKFPKLVELHQKLFNTSPNGLHNSLNDILICLRCFFKLKFNKDILDENNEVNKLIYELLK